MTYDLHGGWEDRTGCNAPLYATEEDQRLSGYDLSVSWAVDYWIANGASPSQLTIGLGSYGRGWTLADLSNSGFHKRGRLSVLLRVRGENLARCHRSVRQRQRMCVHPIQWRVDWLRQLPLHLRKNRFCKEPQLEGFHVVGTGS